MSLVDFANALQRRKLRSPDETKGAIIFDSTPAPLTLPLAIRAFTASTRNRLKKYLMALGLTFALFLSFVFRNLTRRPETISVMIKQLNDPWLLPWTSLRTPRMYFYSDGDRIVPSRAVEEHAAWARMAGYPVHMLNFGKSAHVSHARDYPERYWEAVRSLWLESVRARADESD